MPAEHSSRCLILFIKLLQISLFSAVWRPSHREDSSIQTHRRKHVFMASLFHVGSARTQLKFSDLRQVMCPVFDSDVTAGPNTEPLTADYFLYTPRVSPLNSHGGSSGDSSSRLGLSGMLRQTQTATLTRASFYFLAW